MEKFKQVFKKVFCLPLLPTLLIVIFGYVFVTLVAVLHITIPSVRYLAYISSAYALVITIIISNAVSYTSTNGLIDIIYSVTRTKHIITIADNGSGISDEEKKHIFEKFYRSDCARENSSHFGLGLAIANEIITMHKGKITVCDSKYGGAEFIIALPK